MTLYEGSSYSNAKTRPIAIHCTGSKYIAVLNSVQKIQRCCFKVGTICCTLPLGITRDLIGYSRIQRHSPTENMIIMFCKKIGNSQMEILIIVKKKWEFIDSYSFISRTVKKKKKKKNNGI